MLQADRGSAAEWVPLLVLASPCSRVGDTPVQGFLIDRFCHEDITTGYLRALKFCADVGDGFTFNQFWVYAEKAAGGNLPFDDGHASDQLLGGFDVIFTF